MIDAARRWKARATAGCAQAPDPETTSWSSLITSHGIAEQLQRTRREGPVQIDRNNQSSFATMEESQRVGFDDGLEPDATYRLAGDDAYVTDCR
jgi:hypothetical protein